MPQLLPHQRINVVTLLGLLAELPAENYDHGDYGFGYGPGLATSGCALGLAMANVNKFVEPNGTGELVAIHRPDGYQWSLPSLFENNAFGADVAAMVFGLRAFAPVNAADVTKDMVVERLNNLLRNPLQYGLTN